MGIFKDIFEAGLLPHDDIDAVKAVEADECANGYCAATTVSKTLRLPCGHSICPNCIEAMNSESPECPECEDAIDRLWALTNITPLWADEFRKNKLLEAHYKATTGWSNCECGGGAAAEPAKDTTADCIVCGKTICTYHGEDHTGTPCDARTETIQQEARWQSGGIPCKKTDCRIIITIELSDDCDVVRCPGCGTTQNIAGGDDHTHTFKYKNAHDTLSKLKASTKLSQLKSVVTKNELMDTLFDVSGMIAHLSTCASTDEQETFISKLAFQGLRDCLTRIVNDPTEAAQIATFDTLAEEELIVDYGAEFLVTLGEASSFDAVRNLLDDNKGQPWVAAGDVGLFMNIRSEYMTKVRADMARKEYEPENDVAEILLAIQDVALKEKVRGLATHANIL